MENEREILDLNQGTDEWLEKRRQPFTYCASDAAAMLGLSKYETRQELIKRLASGWSGDVSAFQQKIFDKGHDVERLTRPKIESHIGSQLFPDVGKFTPRGVEYRLLASADGVDLNYKVLWECKQWNEELARYIKEKQDLPDTHWPQAEQLQLCFLIDTLVFTVSDGQENINVFWYKSKKDRREKILNGWRLFHDDLKAYMANHKPNESSEIVVAKPIQDDIPSLVIKAEGRIISSNLDEFRAQHQSFIDRVPTVFETDQDFADAEQYVKWFKEIENRLGMAEQMILSQASDINSAIDMLRSLKQSDRDLRIKFEKKVKERKDSIRHDLIMAAKKEVEYQRSAFNNSILPYSLGDYYPDFAGAIKGLKSIDSIKNAIDRVKIQAFHEMAQDHSMLMANINYFQDVAKDRIELFPDHLSLVHESRQNLENAISARIAEADRLKESREEERKRLEMELAQEKERQEGIYGIGSSLAAKQQEDARNHEKLNVFTPGEFEPVSMQSPDVGIDMEESRERDIDEKIDAFIKHKGLKTRAASKAREIILEWETFR